MLNLQKIKELSELKSIPMTEIAGLLDTSPQALSKMIRENSTKVSTLERLSKIFNVPVGYFFDENPTNLSQVNGDYATAIAGNNNNISISHEVLELLKEKDRQLREKDELISKLVKLLETK